MGDDASLDEFLGDAAAGEPAAETGSDGEPSTDADADSDRAAETEPDGDGSATGIEPDGDGPLADSVAPATTTYEFAPGGVECDACGASVDRRWHQDGDLVCAACKEW